MAFGTPGKELLSEMPRGRVTKMHRIGVIPFSLRASTVQILLVTSQTRGRWILPKGRIEAGETHADACHREAFEEAGIKGTVLEDFPATVVIGKLTEDGLHSVPVTFYPLLVLKRLNRWPEKDMRSRRWVKIENAESIVQQEDYITVLRQFQALQSWIVEAGQQHLGE